MEIWEVTITPLIKATNIQPLGITISNKSLGFQNNLPPMWGAMRYDPNKPGPKRLHFSRYDWKIRADLFPKLPSFGKQHNSTPLKTDGWKLKISQFEREKSSSQPGFLGFHGHFRSLPRYEASIPGLRLQQGIAIFSQGERRDLGRWGSRWCWKK